MPFVYRTKLSGIQKVKRRPNIGIPDKVAVIQMFTLINSVVRYCVINSKRKLEHNNTGCSSQWLRCLKLKGRSNILF